MSKTIKLEDSVYTRLETFRGKRETFSYAVNRLLTMLEKVGELRSLLEEKMDKNRLKHEELKK